MLPGMFSLILLAAFVSAYFAKLWWMRQRYGVAANRFGKGKTGRALAVERLLQVASFTATFAWFLSTVFPGFTDVWFLSLGRPPLGGWLGVAVTAVGVGLFLAAMAAMRSSWRVGVDLSTRTALVTTGLFSISRNPAFTGMAIFFLGVFLTGFTAVSGILAIITASALHLQVLQEEQYLAHAFGQEYLDYCKRTPHYLLF